MALTPKRIDQDRAAYLEIFGQGTPFMQAIDRETWRLFRSVRDEPLTAKESTRRVGANRIAVHSKVQQVLGVQDDFQRRRTPRDEFECSRGSLLKRIQSVFTSDEALQIFPPEEPGSAHEIIIDPRKITDDMLSALSIHRPHRTRLSAVEKLEIRTSAIPAIKNALSTSLEPMPLYTDESSNPRFYIVTQGDNQGKILAFRTEGKRSTFYVTTLHSLARQIDHIREGYAEEIGQLGDVKVFIDRIISEVQGDWQAVRESGRLEEIQDEITEYIESLENVRNPYKLAILAKLEEGWSFKDSLGRQNPGAVLTKLASVKDEANKRIAEIGRISKFHSRDYIQVLEVMGEEVSKFRRFNDQVQNAGDRLRVLNTDTPISQADRGLVKMNLMNIRRICEEFRFKPYIDLARDMIARIDTIIEVLDSGSEEPADREKAKFNFLSLFSASKIIEFEELLLGTRNTFFHPRQNLRTISAKALVGDLKKARGSLQRKVAAENGNIREYNENVSDRDKVPDYYDIYVELYRLLGEWIGMAMRASTSTTPEEEKLQVLREIDQGIKKFDPTEFLSKEPKVAENCTED